MLVESAAVFVFVGSVVIFAIGFPITMLFLPFLIPIMSLAWVQLMAADRVRRGRGAGAYGVVCAVALILGSILAVAQVVADEGPASASSWAMLAVTLLLTLPSLAALIVESRGWQPLEPRTVAVLAALTLCCGVLALLTMPVATA